MLALTEIEYLQMVDYTGRQVRAHKRGAIAGPPPTILQRLGYSPDNWTRQVLAIRSDFSRAVGAVEMLAEKAAEIGSSGCGELLRRGAWRRLESQDSKPANGY